MEALYRRLYHQLRRRPFRRIKDGKDELAVFAPVIGKHYGCNDHVRLMWVGRAVNQWTRVDVEADENAFLEAIRKGQEQEEPFRFLWAPATNRSCFYYLTSPFWRTSKLVCERLMPEEAWPESIAWANLYAAAPCGGGNPSKTLSAAQRIVCGELLKAEVDRLQPTHIVLMTDWDWFSEFNEAKPSAPVFPDIHPGENGLIVGSGYIGHGMAVVTKRPEGRSSDQEYAEAVCAAFERMTK